MQAPTSPFNSPQVPQSSHLFYSNTVQNSNNDNYQANNNMQFIQA